jgi:UDPglucose--hexose-1-phosphate uridylyltransferase
MKPAKINFLRFIKNPSSGNYVIISTQRAGRPDDHAQDNVCPFCPGNEDHTPPEVSRFPKSGNWSVRVVPNKFPITETHEVVILTPNHDEAPFNYTPNHWIEVLKVYRDRFNTLGEKGLVSIFHNHGLEAGESRKHDHSQIVVVPKNIQIRNLPTEPVENIVHESNYFSVYLPAASSWPFESVVLPKDRGRFFGEIEDVEIKDLSGIFHTLLKNIEKNLAENFPFNFYIYHEKDWYIRLIPRVKTPAGFELATAIFVNTQDPSEAAEKISW